MKKVENHKRNTALKNEYYSRSRSHSPKAYRGCDTCKLKHATSVSKLSDYEKSKVKKSPKLGKDEPGLKHNKIRLIHLCDEDKKRLVELIEELTKLAEKNQKLKEELNQITKEKQEQQNYFLKQATIFLEEKNFYVNEINLYKTKLELYESEMKSTISQFKNHKKSKGNEITYLVRALQKTLKEKDELHEEMNQLKVSLKNSLESFQKLKAQVTELQHQEQEIRKYQSVSCQTESKITPKERPRPYEEDTEDEEYLSTGNQDSARSSLDIISDRLESVYQLLKKRKDSSSNTNIQKQDALLSSILKNDLAKEDRSGNVCQKTEDEPLKAEREENEFKFMKPFDECCKSSVQAERILEKVGIPFNININESTQTIELNNLFTFKPKETTRDAKKTNVLQNKIVQKNAFYRSSNDQQYDEDRLLEELFYSDQSSNLGLDPFFKIKRITKKCDNPPFTR